MFRKVLFACLTLCFFLFGSCSCMPTQMHSQPYISDPINVSHLQNSTVALLLPPLEEPTAGPVQNTEGQEHMPYCTGFFIDSQTVVTANHCTTITDDEDEPIGHVDQVRVATYQFYREDHEFKKYVVFDLVGWDEDSDVAILRLNPANRLIFYRESLALESSVPHTGNEVFALGHPVGEPYLLTVGIISTEPMVTDDGVHIVRATANVYFGNSGGPLVNNQGEVIGVCHSLVMRQSYLGSWIDIMHVRKLMHTIHYRLLNQHNNS